MKKHHDITKEESEVRRNFKAKFIKVLCTRCYFIQGCGSAFISSGSGSNILGWIPIRIQGFNDQKLKKKKLQKRLVAICHSFFDLLFFGTWFRHEIHYIMVAWMMWTGSGWKLDCSGFVVYRSDLWFSGHKVSRGITQCSPQDSNLFPHIRGSNGPVSECPPA